MHPPRLFQTTTFRLTAVYVLVFAALVAALGTVTYLATSITLERRLDARIQRETEALQAADRMSGFAGLLSALKQHQRTHPNGLLDHAVLGAKGERLAGRLPRIPRTLGWSSLEHRERDGDITRLRALATPLSGGGRLVVAADREEIEEARQAIFDGFASAFGAVLGLGILGGIALSFAFLKRVDTIRRTAEAIIGGDLSRRVPVHGSGDDLDRLSQTLNRMLDRIGELMEGIRQVSADIAHDLKTPLTRLRLRLESTRAQPAEQHGAAIEAALDHIDEILATFNALLRIAQIEAGTRRAGFCELDLSDIFATVLNAFEPAAEDAGKSLTGDIAPDIRISGDRELLTQMLANIVENAVRHTPPGVRIAVMLKRQRDEIFASVVDNGPGVPAKERERLFQRFYRLEHSRSTAGSGLGLSLVKAIADLHDIQLEIRDAKPGLAVCMQFVGGLKAKKDRA